MSSRSRRRRGIVAFVAFLLAGCGLVVAFAGGASASGPAGRSQAQAPVEASMSMLITQLSNVNLDTATFDANFYMSITCKKPCPSGDWDILNAESMTREVVSQKGDTTWWLVRGTFVFDPTLRLFPFDTQNLSIKFEHRSLDESALIFVPDVEGSEVASEVTVAGWEVENFQFTASSTTYKIFAEDYSRLTFTVPVSRSTLASVTKYYIPLAIFILVAGATLVLNRFDIQLGTSGSALVGVTVFYLATNGGAGSVGYLTVWDLSVLVGFLALGLVLLCGVTGLYRTEHGAFEGDDGVSQSAHMRRRFMGAFGAIVAIGALGIAIVAVLT